ncbi:XRE family transcriptional regulator [Actinomadura sp. 9N407]|uniref:XRE family transcriptional regulator n=1 Tax=Actinomadura sp. 9N407 TaxID=3375154 RepID=UPI0037A8C647
MIVKNERLRSVLINSGYTEQQLADELGLDAKSVQRWITRGVTPRRPAAYRTARLLEVPVTWLWPDLEGDREATSQSEIVTHYSHRANTPRQLWSDLLTNARTDIWLLANASLFLPEENPDSIEIIRGKAREGVKVRIVLGDPDSPEMVLRGVEERLYDAIPARIRMALTYYSPLVGTPGIDFMLHRTSLYNSIFRYDDQMLVNQHMYGTYGYIAPILHLRRIEGADLFDTYLKSFERVWETATPIEESNFWQQRTQAHEPTNPSPSARP